jgi:acyl-homoserine lactone acylase PvdQ
MSRRFPPFLLLLLLFAFRSSDAPPVTIYRDAYGVAHVYGRTDADAAFGFAYVQAEDNFWQVEENYIRALGRAAEVDGERGPPAPSLNPSAQRRSALTRLQALP